MSKQNQPRTRIGERDARTGQFVPAGTARIRPSTTVRERVPLKGYGDTRRSK